MNEECLECGHALCLQGCAHPLHRSEREREMVIEFISLLLTMAALKGMTGALAY